MNELKGFTVEEKKQIKRALTGSIVLGVLTGGLSFIYSEINGIRKTLKDLKEIEQMEA